jgi:hypothetical protein
MVNMKFYLGTIGLLHYIESPEKAGTSSYSSAQSKRSDATPTEKDKEVQGGGADAVTKDTTGVQQSAGPPRTAEGEVKCRSILGIHMHEHMQLRYADEDAYPTSADVWSAIKRSHRQQSASRAGLLMDQLHKLRKGAKESVTQYATRVCNLAAELSQAGHPQSQGQVAMSFLKGLPSSYDITPKLDVWPCQVALCTLAVVLNQALRS